MMSSPILMRASSGMGNAHARSCHMLNGCRMAADRPHRPLSLRLASPRSTTSERADLSAMGANRT